MLLQELRLSKVTGFGVITRLSERNLLLKVNAGFESFMK